MKTNIIKYNLIHLFCHFWPLLFFGLLLHYDAKCISGLKENSQQKHTSVQYNAFMNGTFPSDSVKAEELFIPLYCMNRTC